MQHDKHPHYQEILFIDSSTDSKFLIGSTLKCKETQVFEGKEYPCVYVSVSSASHRHFIGEKAATDQDGPAKRFAKKFEDQRERAKKEQEKKEEESKKQQLKARKK